MKTPTDLDLYEEYREFDEPELEEVPLPTWGEIIRDPETWPPAIVLILTLILNFTW